MLNLSKYLSLKRFKFCASYENKTRFMEIVFYSRGLFPFEKSLCGRVFDIRSKGHKGAFNTDVKRTNLTGNANRMLDTAIKPFKIKANILFKIK